MRVETGEGALGDLAQRLQAIQRGEGSAADSREPAMMISRVTGWIESGDDASRLRITR